MQIGYMVSIVISSSTKEIAQKEWLKHWAGGWSLLSSSYFGQQYTHSIEKELATRLDSACFVHHHGYGVAFLQREETDKFGGKLARQVIENGQPAIEWCTSLKKQTDNILGVISGL